MSFARATTEINSLYHNQGYLYAQVNDVVERVPAEGDGPPRVNVSWEIEEGRPAFINRVRITGNTFTHEDVIRGQLVILPGDLYSEDLLIQSYRRISALGFFETPMAFPQILPNESGDVDITFNVKEKQTGSVNFGTALGGVSGVAGFLGYDQPNLFGKAKSGHLRWEFGRYSNNFEASYSDPSILDTRYSGSLSLFSSRDRFFTFQEGRRRRTGIGLRFGVPVLDVNSTRLSVGYSVSRTTYEEVPGSASALPVRVPPRRPAGRGQPPDEPLGPPGGRRIRLCGHPARAPGDDPHVRLARRRKAAGGWLRRLPDRSLGPDRPRAAARPAGGP
jgi:outer membrane protein insertion porin family